MSAQGASDPQAILEQATARLRAARAERAVAVLERQTRRIKESAVLWDVAGAYGDLLDRIKTKDGNLLLAPSTAQDRRHGANWPHWRTWHEHSILRAQSRFLATVSDLAFGAIGGLASYVVGDGMTHLAVAKKGKEVPPSLVDACNAEIDDYIARNDLQGLEQENFKDSRIDGEAFTRSFVDDEGRTEERIVLPEQIIDDPGEPPETGSFGLRNPEGDTQTITHYHVCYDGDQGDGEWVPASEMTAYKINVGRTVKRGMPDLVYDTHQGIKSASRCVTNMIDGAAAQASVTEIRQHEAATAAQVQDFVDGIADYDLADPLTGLREQHQRAKSGTVRDIPKGMTYVPPPFSQGGQTWIAITQAALRKVGVRWNAPEWLTSGDASNNNYSSALVAESPFHRRVLRWQGYYSRRNNGRVRRALRAAAEAGRIRAEGRTWTWDEVRRLIDVTTEAPAVQTRDPNAEAQANSVRVQAGVLSVQTWAQQDGLDYDREQANIEEHNERTGGGMAGLMGGVGGVAGAAGGAQAPDDAGEDDPFADLDGEGDGSAATATDAEGAQSLRATVGGSQAIADLQRAVYAGEMPREAAVANARIVFGFSPEEAEQLFPQVAPSSSADDGDGGEGDEDAIDIGGDDAIDLSEAVRHDRRGHVYCTDDTSGKRVGCKPGEVTQHHRTHVMTHGRVYDRIRDIQRQGPLTAEHVAEVGRMMARLTVADLRSLNKTLAAKAGNAKRHRDLVAAIKKRALGADARTLAQGRQLELGQSPLPAGAAPLPDERRQKAADPGVGSAGYRIRAWFSAKKKDFGPTAQLARDSAKKGRSREQFLSKITGADEEAQRLLGDYYDELRGVRVEPATPRDPEARKGEKEKPSSRKPKYKLKGGGEAAVRRFFGESMDMDAFAASVCAAEDGATVEVDKSSEYVIQITTKSKSVHAIRKFVRRGEHLACVNESIRIPEGSRLRGYQVFHEQTKALRALGVRYIEAQAAGPDTPSITGEEYNGHYTWPRLGYSGQIPKSSLENMPAEIKDRLGNSREILDLYEIPGGKEWWKKNGESLTVKFDLAEGSRNIKTLEAYVNEREGRTATA